MSLLDIEHTDFFSVEQISDYRALFRKHDEDGGGNISIDELGCVFSEIGLSLERDQLESIMNEIDVDQSGRVDFDEFCHMMIKFTGAHPRVDLIDFHDYLDEATIEDLTNTFIRADVDNTRSLNIEQFKPVLKEFGLNLTQEQVNRIWTEVDRDGSGAIEFDEFCNMYCVISGKSRRRNYREYFDNDSIESFRAQFNLIDESGDGFVDHEEIDQLFRNLGLVLKKEQLEKVVKEFDTDGSGSIDFPEFCAMMIKMRGEKKKRKIGPRTCTVDELVQEGFTVEDLKIAGFRLQHLKGHVSSARLVKEGEWRVLDFRHAGFSCTDLRKGGVGAYEMRRCGYSLVDLRASGFSAPYVRQSSQKLRRKLTGGEFCLPVRHPTDTNDAQDWLSRFSETPRIRYHTDYSQHMKKKMKGAQKKLGIMSKFLAAGKIAPPVVEAQL